eukprot:scaffold1135_cov343-Prasinococcus_capsulatus_cf.AAC.6
MGSHGDRGPLDRVVWTSVQKARLAGPSRKVQSTIDKFFKRMPNSQALSCQDNPEAMKLYHSVKPGGECNNFTASDGLSCGDRGHAENNHSERTVEAAGSSASTAPYPAQTGQETAAIANDWWQKPPNASDAGPEQAHVKQIIHQPNHAALSVKLKAPKCMADTFAAHDTNTETRCPDANEMSEYERRRNAQIAKNRAMMASLGLAEAAQTFSRNSPAPSQLGASKKRSRIHATAVPSLPSEEVPLRRSARRHYSRSSNEDVSQSPLTLRKDGDLFSLQQRHKGCDAQHVALSDNEAAEESPFFKYTIQDAPPTSVSDKSASTHLEDPESSFRGYFPKGVTLFDDLLTRIYSLDAAHDIVAAGGHQGYMTLWNLNGIRDDGQNEEAELSSSLSFKGHAGWVSQLQFKHQGGARRLLSTANDGKLCIWDIGKQLDGNALCLASNGTLHASGIFSMQERSSKILTASKDKNVVVSSICEDRVEKLWDFEHHDSVVKCARWQSNRVDVFASCGNDGQVYVVDTRCRGTDRGLAHVLPGHGHACNFVEWNPTDDNVLLSCSFEPFLLLHDLRKPEQPLQRLSGHVTNGYPGYRCKRIYKPVFVNAGQVIATSGENSNKLTFYSVATGQRISQGDFGFDPTSIFASSSFANNGNDDPSCDVLYVSQTKCVSLFKPHFRKASNEDVQ